MHDDVTGSRTRRLAAAAKRYLTRQTPRQQRARWQQRTADRVVPDQHFQTAVYFAGGTGDLPRLRQWFTALAAWDEQSPCVIVCRDAAAALDLLDDSPVLVIHAAWVDDIETFAAAQRLRLVLYVDQNTRNLQMMRMNTVLHVFTGTDRLDDLLCGQVRCYDYAFVADPADADRMRAEVLHYDVATRTRTVGPARAQDPTGVPAGIDLQAWLDACADVVGRCDALLSGGATRG